MNKQVETYTFADSPRARKMHKWCEKHCARFKLTIQGQGSVPAEAYAVFGYGTTAATSGAPGVYRQTYQFSFPDESEHLLFKKKWVEKRE
jgi:hypothetical protein